jgi:toxin ParE1/3/4
VTELVVTDQAERDLTRIVLRVAQDNERAAFKLVDEIRAHCGLLPRVPLMGRLHSDIRSDIRSFPHGSYVVYYRPVPARDEIHILRIWHGRRRAPTMADLL